MTISDHNTPSGPTAPPRLQAPSPPQAPPLSQAPPPPAGLEEAQRLISDLKALVDARLVVVHEQLGGPARYDVIPELGDAA
jgi:hypothetical protein